MNRTYRDSGGMTAKPRTEEAMRPLIGAYRLLLGGSDVLTLFVDEDGSPLSIRVDPNLDLADTMPIRELILAADAFGGGALILYNLDCTDLMTSRRGIAYRSENEPALTPASPIFVDGTVTRPGSKEVISDAA